MEDVRRLSFHSVSTMLTRRGSLGVMVGGFTGERTVSSVVLVSELERAPTVPVGMTVVRTTTADGAPPPRSRCLHTATPLSEYVLLVFGGWHREPGGRRGEAAAGAGAAGVAFMVAGRAGLGGGGGRDRDDAEDGVFLGDCFTLDTVRMRWRPAGSPDGEGEEAEDGARSCGPPSTSRRPGPRCGHSAVLVSERVYVFGGETPHGQTNQLYVYDPATGAWSLEEHLRLVNAAGAHRLPAGRSGHSAAKVGGRMIVHGGFSNDAGALRDTHLFDVAACAWTEVVPDYLGAARRTAAACRARAPGLGELEEEELEEEDEEDDADERPDGEWAVYCPPPRTGHAAGAVGLRMYVHGGYDAEGNLSDELIALDTAVLRAPRLAIRGEALETYEAIELPEPEGDGASPPASRPGTPPPHRPRLSLSLRRCFQWFISTDGAPFVAIKTARDLRRYRPSIDQMGAVLGVSCSVLCGNDPVGLVSRFVQTPEVRPDAFLLATCRMLLVRQEATFTNLALLPPPSQAAADPGSSAAAPAPAPEAAVTLRLSRTQVRLRAGDEARVCSAYLPGFAMLVRPEPTEVLMQVSEEARYLLRSRTPQERDLMVLVGRGFFALGQRLLL